MDVLADGRLRLGGAHSWRATSSEEHWQTEAHLSLLRVLMLTMLDVLGDRQVLVRVANRTAELRPHNIDGDPARR